MKENKIKDKKERKSYHNLISHTGINSTGTPPLGVVTCWLSSVIEILLQLLLLLLLLSLLLLLLFVWSIPCLKVMPKWRLIEEVVVEYYVIIEKLSGRQLIEVVVVVCGGSKLYTCVQY